MILPLVFFVDFMNFDYAQIPCSSNVPPPALVRNGSYPYFDQKMGAGFDVYVVGVHRGSLRAGTQQAIVVLACQFPIGGTARAYAYDIRGKSATLLGDVGATDWGADWGARPTSIHITFDKRFLYVDSCENSDCTMSELRTYALRAGKLIKVRAQTHQTRAP